MHPFNQLVHAGLAIFLASALTASAQTLKSQSDSELMDGVAAFVNGKAITIHDVAEGIPEQLRALAKDPQMYTKSKDEVFSIAFKASLEESIDTQLILQEYWAGEQRIPETAITQSLNDMIEQRYKGDRKVLQEELSQFEMSYDDWIDMMEEQIIIRSMRQSFVGANIHISPNEIAKAYAARKTEWVKPEQVHVFTLALPTDATNELADVRARLAKGEAFTKLAKEVSVDTFAENGGNYGWISPEEMLAPALAKAVNALNDGEISKPVKLGKNQYIVYRKASSASEIIPLREAQKQIEADLYDQEAQKMFKKWLERLRTSAQITIIEKP